MAEKVITCNIKGDDLQRALEKLARPAAKKIIRGGLKAGADVIRTEMLETVPVDTGILEENIGTRFSMKGGDTSGAAFIGPKGKAFYPPGESKGGLLRAMTGKLVKGRAAMPVATIARFLEFGTKDMAARPFMTQAFEAQKQNALQKIVAVIRDALGL